MPKVITYYQASAQAQSVFRFAHPVPENQQTAQIRKRIQLLRSLAQPVSRREIHQGETEEEESQASWLWW